MELRYEQASTRLLRQLVTGEGPLVRIAIFPKEGGMVRLYFCYGIVLSQDKFAFVFSGIDDAKNPTVQILDPEESLSLIDRLLCQFALWRAEMPVVTLVGGLTKDVQAVKPSHSKLLPSYDHIHGWLCGYFDAYLIATEEGGMRYNDSEEQRFSNIASLAASLETFIEQRNQENWAAEKSHSSWRD